MQSLSTHIQSIITAAIVAAGSMLVGGCASYTDKSDKFIQPFIAGQFNAAVSEVTAQAGTVDAPDKTLDEQAKAPARDILLLRLEQGAVYRLAADYTRSNLAFEHARQLVEKFDEKARIRLGEGAAVLVTNLTAVEYRGQYFDRVMLSVYRALNYLESGNADAARPELLAAYERQRETVEKYARQIDAERTKVIKEGSAPQKNGGGAAKADVNKSIDDPQTQARLSQAYAGLNELAAYEDYVNPFAEYLQGLYFLHAGVDGSDIERGRTALRKTAALVPDNSFISQDAELADQIASAAAPRPKLTYVIFETGLAPRRDEFRIDIPIFLFNIIASDTQVDYVGVAFPKLVPSPDHTPYLQIASDAGTLQTRTVADMDRIVAREFQSELGAVIAKTIAAAATKAAIAYAASRATEDNDTLNVLVRIGTTVYQYAANRADTRTWRTLPKKFQVARIPTPENRTIQLSLPNGAMLPAVQLIPGEINVVYIRSASSLSPTLVRQFKLR